jgi:hypothetical protein
MCAAGLAVAAVVMWLLGKAVRVVLTGPTKETTRPHSPSVVHRNTSVPPGKARGPHSGRISTRGGTDGAWEAVGGRWGVGAGWGGKRTKRTSGLPKPVQRPHAFPERHTPIGHELFATPGTCRTAAKKLPVMLWGSKVH